MDDLFFSQVFRLAPNTIDIFFALAGRGTERLKELRAFVLEVP